MATWLTRLRHRHGFGVHSPYAFRILNNVVRRGYPYYGYDILADVADKRLRRDAMLLFRIVARLAPASAVVPENLPAPLRRVLELADSRCKILTTPPTTLPDAPMLYLGYGRVPECALRVGDILLALGLDHPQAPRNPVEGVTFVGRSGLLILRRPECAPQVYHI